MRFLPQKPALSKINLKMDENRFYDRSFLMALPSFCRKRPIFEGCLNHFRNKKIKDTSFLTVSIKALLIFL